jgi:hypothetical protein
MTTQPTLTPNGWQDPPMLNTTNGLMAPADLKKFEGGHDDETEACAWVEYRLAGEIVHRSVDLKLKKAIFADGFQGSL